jgi:hypothetical protein
MRREKAAKASQKRNRSHGLLSEKIRSRSSSKKVRVVSII